MTTPSPTPQNPHDICTWKSAAHCQDCAIAGDLKCRMNWRDASAFMAVTFPVMLIGAIGMIQAGYGWYLLGWVAFMLFFFFVWEARILCSHCPYWAENDRTLHCIANYGVIKIWRYRPEPLSRSEKIQFIIGANILMWFPLPFILLGGQFIWALLLVAGLGVLVWHVRRTTCTRCVNFSCPSNRVPKSVVDAYLMRNPVMREAWEKSGWQIDDASKVSATR
jgi:hypothetical protein